MTVRRLIEALLPERSFPDRLGRLADRGLRSIVIEPTLDGGEADHVAALALGRRLAVVSDADTHEAMGRRVERALREVATVDGVVLDGPRADVATAERVIEQCRHAEGLVAVGSGTLNDLTKYAAFSTGRPYAVFATAASMNGYVTATASLAEGGVKTSLPAHCPRGAFFDLDVVRRAPLRLTRAGLGDALCRTTAQVDWRLSRELLDTAYDATPFDLQAEDEPPLLDLAGRLPAGDVAAIERLVRVLVLSGLGMVIAASSSPASQGEHLISHYLDMMAGARHPGSLHGEQVGVATLTISRMQNALLTGAPPPRLRPIAIDRTSITARFGERIGRHCLAELEAKIPDAGALERLNAALAARWPEIRATLGAIMVPTARLEATLEAAGAPTTGAALGFESGFYREAVRHAREVRNRFTILDLAAHAGCLDDLAANEH